MATSLTAAAIAALRDALLRENDLTALPQLPSLLTALAAPSTSVFSGAPLVEALRDVFTHYFHVGLLVGGGGGVTEDSSEKALRKRKRADAMTVPAAAALAAVPASGASSSTDGGGNPALAKWLRGQFWTFMLLLVRLIAEQHKLARTPAPTDVRARGRGKSQGAADDEGTSSAAAEDAAIALRVLALDSIVHFTAHAVPLSVQASERGGRVAFDVLVWFLRLSLSAANGVATGKSSGATTTPDVAASKAVVVETPAVARNELVATALACNLSNALTAFRTTYVDDYDDIRYYTLKAIALIATAKARNVEQGRGGRDASGRRTSAPAGTTAEGRGDAADTHMKQKKQRLDRTGASSSTVDAAAAGSASGTAAAAGIIAATTSETETSPALLDSAAAAAADSATLGRNAATLLLAIALPPSEMEWQAAERNSWMREQLEGLVSFPPLTCQSEGGSAGEGHASDAPGPKYLDDSDAESDAGLPRATPTGSDDSASKRKSALAESALPKWAQLLEQRRVYSEAWLAVLRLPLPAEVMRRVLLALPARILPHMPARHPLLLSDFLTQCCDHGGALALLGLQSLFHLMQHHGLEYPRFYTRLYALFGTDTVHALSLIHI